MKTTRTVLMLCLVAACSDSGSDSVRCGEGTMEENGTCVPAADDDDDASTGSPATTAATRADDDDGNDEGDGETSFGDSSGAAPSTYASCFAGSDVECTHDEQCIESLDTCASLCAFDTDCPAPSGGTAVQRCETLDGYWSEICVLYCGVEGAACPLGMVCRETTLCEGDDGSSSSGGWGTTGCGTSILPICVWE